MLTSRKEARMLTQQAIMDVINRGWDEPHRFGLDPAPVRRVVRPAPDEEQSGIPARLWDDEQKVFVRTNPRGARGWQWSSDLKLVSYSISRKRYELVAVL
jgi:hypothetical protein